METAAQALTAALADGYHQEIRMREGPREEETFENSKGTVQKKEIEIADRRELARAV